MQKLLLLLIVAYLVWKLGGAILRAQFQKPQSPMSDATPPLENIVRCQVCGIFTPESETTQARDGSIRCSDRANCAERLQQRSNARS